MWETCLELLQPEVLAAEYRRRTAQDEQGGDDAALGRIRADLKAVERQERRWQDAYAAEAIDLPTLKTRMDGCRAQREALEARLTTLGQAQARRAHEARVLASLEAFAGSVGEGLETADFAKRQQVIRLMVERVVVEDGGRLRIELAIPLGGHGGGSGGQRDPQPSAGSGLGPLRSNCLDTDLQVLGHTGGRCAVRQLQDDRRTQVQAAFHPLPARPRPQLLALLNSEFQPSWSPHRAFCTRPNRHPCTSS